MSLLNDGDLPRRVLPPKLDTAAPTSEPELRATIATVNMQSAFHTNIIGENRTGFPQSEKLGYYREDELQDGRRIYRCAHSMCGYYSERMNNVTRHYIRKHFYHCRYPKCSFSTALQNDFIKHLWTHNSSFASSIPTDSQTST